MCIIVYVYVYFVVCIFCFFPLQRFSFSTVILLVGLLTCKNHLPYNDNNNNNNNRRQFVRRRNMSVDITRAPYRQSGNVVRDSSTETRL